MSDDHLVLEDEFIIRTLSCFVEDLKTSKPVSEIIDKQACILTAYMNGKLTQLKDSRKQQ